MAVAFVTACNTAPTVLLATLPTEAGGLSLDSAHVIDDSFLSGHVVDDVLAALGKRRTDATVVFRGNSQGTVSIGAIAVRGVRGDDLLKACVENWEAPAVIRTTQRVVNDTQGWELETRGDGMLTVFYLRGDVAYVARGERREVLEAVLADMP